MDVSIAIQLSSSVHKGTTNSVGMPIYSIHQRETRLNFHGPKRRVQTTYTIKRSAEKFWEWSLRVNWGHVTIMDYSIDLHQWLNLETCRIRIQPYPLNTDRDRLPTAYDQRMRVIWNLVVSHYSSLSVNLFAPSHFFHIRTLSEFLSTLFYCVCCLHPPFRYKGVFSLVSLWGVEYLSIPTLFVVPLCTDDNKWAAIKMFVCGY